MNNNITDAEFVEDMRTYRIDHLPNGYPCVQTWQIDRLIKIIDQKSALLVAVRQRFSASSDV